MRLTMLTILMLGSLSFVPGSELSAQTNGKALNGRTFDFWVGQWNTEMTNTPKWEKKMGTDTVKKHLDGRLLEEVFRKGAEGDNFQRGYLFYLRRNKTWHHSIYDAKWGEYEFFGGKVGDDIVLQSPDDDSRPGKRRETFYNIKPDSFDYKWEESQDGGKTWNVYWKVKYRRANKE